MHIASFRIRNYKSWVDSSTVTLGSGFNVIVGQNNAGKSALLEALSLFPNSLKPHRSGATIPKPGSQPSQISKISITFGLEEGEAFELLRNIPNAFTIPSNLRPERVLGNLQEGLLRLRSLSVEFENGNIVDVETIPHITQVADGHGYHALVNRETNEPILSNPSRMPLPGPQAYFSYQIAEQLRALIYFSHAERYNVGQSSVENNSKLTSKSDNLAQVLNNLMTSDRKKFDDFVNFVSKVIPQVKGVIVPPIGANTAQVKIWTTPPVDGRSDLAFPISESGTGVGQVLAMLYLVVTSNSSQCFLIDEPQSFLHPAALRNLLDIFKQFRHQYVIATHSASVLRSESNILHVRNDGIRSLVDVIEAPAAKEIRLVLEDVGTRLSDLFGADSILWVEGSTEENCFRLIVDKLMLGPFWGVEIIGVKTTGEFGGKDAELIYDIYTRLSRGKAVIPPAIGFIFDREGKTETQRQDLIRKGSGKVHFTKKRMFENYLLLPSAISSVMDKIMDQIEKRPTEGEVEAWINRHGANPKMFVGGKIEKPFSDGWFDKVDGATLLQDLFKAFSENRYTYDKVRHGFALTEEILSTSPANLTELADLIRIALQPNNHQI